jgi:inorganic triphosphatase YgiF
VGHVAKAKLLRIVEKALKGAALHPAFEIVIQRATRKTRSGGSELELALDDGW